MVVHPDTARLAHVGWGRPSTRLAPSAPASDDLFERTAPLYAFMREHLFRDDTDRIARSLWPGDNPPHGTRLLEIGCGPGVHARRLATRYPGVHAVGVDRSDALVSLAAARATSEELANCHFAQGDALALDWPDASVDAVIASRLFTVVDAPGALREVHRVLQPGGRCVVAEPASVLGTLLPFVALRLVGWLAGVQAPPESGGVSGHRPRRLPEPEFVSVVHSQDWSHCTFTRANGYLYAACQKSQSATT